MDSVGSSSNVQTVEEHLADIQQSLDALKLKTDAQEVKGLSQWKAFANELSTLKKDLKDSKGKLNYYKDVVFTEFKDAANTTGNFSNRITALESAVKKILEKFNLLCLPSTSCCFVSFRFLSSGSVSAVFTLKLADMSSSVLGGPHEISNLLMSP